MNEGTLYLWKFLISSDKWTHDPEDESLAYKGCVAAVVASTRESAVAALTRYAAENGLDARWLRAARVVQLPLLEGVVGAWAEV